MRDLIAFIPAKPGKKFLWIILSLFCVILLRNSWLSDDCYITMRSVFNFTHGYGPVFNVGERVQSFTHPLWMLLISIIYKITKETFFSLQFLSIGVSMLAAYFIAFKILRAEWKAVAAIGILCLSKSFIDYNSSGLENCLTHLLLAGFLWIWLSQTRENKLFWLSLIAAFEVVNRMDTLLLLLPALTVEWLRKPSFKAVLQVSLGFLPLLVWISFAIIYYGFIFPNTAYSKLNTGIPAGETWQQGFFYFLNSLELDPITLILIIGAIVFVFFSSQQRKSNWPIALGMLIYLVYVMKAGGDFMSGRFLSATVMISVILIAQSIERKFLHLAFLGALLFFGLLSPGFPLLTRPANEQTFKLSVDARGIADEKSFWESRGSLLKASRQSPLLQAEKYLASHQNPVDKPSVELIGPVGLEGYKLGPSTVLIDYVGLVDPLLARLPTLYDPGWRIGHFNRVVPRGYVNSVAAGENQFEDPRMGEYYRRLSEILRMLCGNSHAEECSAHYSLR